jgi:hypothetical protein
MIHKIVMWISVIATIAGIVIIIVQKLLGPQKINLSTNVIYTLIISGTCLSVILAITEKKQDTDRVNGSINAKRITGNQAIITNPQNVESINIGDISTNADKRYESGYLLIKEEIISNYTNLNVLIKGIQDNKPEKFWDIRKPNESEDAYQERAKNFHKEYQNYIFQMIQKFPISQAVYNTHKLNISHNSDIADKIQKSYDWLTESYKDLISYSEGLQHNISLDYSDLEMFNKNESLYKEKYVNSRILLLQSIDKFLEAYPSENKIVASICADLNYNIKFASSNFTKREIQLEASRLYKEKGAIIEERIKKPQRKEDVDRIIRDPYLLMLRKSVGLTDTLTESEAWSLKQKKIDTSITASSDLVSAAAFSYIESDGRASIIYLEKALANNDFSETIRIFIEKSIERLKNPDIYEGSIGLIIMEINENSILQQKGLKVGDIIFKMNGELLIEPSEISSMLAKTKKDEDILFEIYQSENQVKRIAIPGSSTIGCKLSQLVTLNSFQL